MRKQVEIETEINNTKELLTKLEKELVENSKQVAKFNRKVKYLKSLKPGHELRVNKACRKSSKEHAFENNKIGQVITNTEHALIFMSDQLIGSGNYTLTFLEFREDVGDQPGAKFKLSHPGFDIKPRIIYFGVESLILKDE